MSGSGGSAVSRRHGGDRFYNPPAMRRHRQMLLQQHQELQTELHRASKSDCAATSAMMDAGIRTDSDDSAPALSKPSFILLPSPPIPPPPIVTNLDRFLESVTPFVTAHHLSGGNVRGRRTRDAQVHSFYCLGDLWESFNEWSVYGVEVPLLLNGKDHVKQYYVPFLSGIQLYVDPSKPPSCVIVQYMEPDGQLLFEYLEQEQPHHRKPLVDKISVLASQFPELRKYRSCDLLPSSWISVAWYPIYRIPMGPTLRDLDASFLTFHYLSTHSRRNSASSRKVHPSAGASSKIPLPVFGLASYKLKGSILIPCGPHECEQENSLLQAAGDWLQQLQVVLPDYQFFHAHYSQWR